MIGNQQSYPKELLDPLIIELGNKNTRVWFDSTFISFPSTLTFPSSQTDQSITIGNHPFVTTLSQTPNLNTNNNNSSLILYDMVQILGRKYVQLSFQKTIKYFPCDFAQGRDQQIQPMLPQSDANGVLGGCVKKHCSAEFLIAVIIRSAVEWAMKVQGSYGGEDNSRLFEFSRRHKVIILANDSILHSQKLAINNVLKIALSELELSSKMQALTQFQFQIMKSTSAIALDFYATSIYSPEPLITQTRSLPICLIDFSDRSFSLSIISLSSSTSTLNTIHLQSNRHGGGQILTRLLVQQVLNIIWKERGLDIKKNCLLMAQLVIECQNAKITLSRQKQAFVRVERLPDERQDFGYLITRQRFQEIVKGILESNVAVVKKALKENQTEKQKQTQIQSKLLKKGNTHSEIIKTNQFSQTTYALHQRKVSTFLISGGSSQIPLFQRIFLQQIPHERVIWVQQKSAVRGASFLNKPLPSEELTSLRTQPILFDRSSTTLYLQPQQQPLSVLIMKNDYIPTRRSYNLRFPPGNLTFRLRVFQLERKIAEYIILDNLESENYYFTLTFQMNRNGLFKLYGSTKKGKIKMVEDLRGLNQEEVKLNIVNLQRVKAGLVKNNNHQQN